MAEHYQAMGPVLPGRWGNNISRTRTRTPHCLRHLTPPTTFLTGSRARMGQYHFLYTTRIFFKYNLVTSQAFIHLLLSVLLSGMEAGRTILYSTVQLVQQHVYSLYSVCADQQQVRLTLESRLSNILGDLTQIYWQSCAQNKSIKYILSALSFVKHLLQQRLVQRLSYLWWRTF